MQAAQVIMLPVEQISIGKRQRTVDKGTETHINELASDIAQDGLLHAVTVNKNFELVAGWCRLNAIKSLDKPYYYASVPVAPGFIPCVITHQQDQRVLYRLELMENQRRKNLSPIDQAKAIAALHRMFQEDAGASKVWTESQTGQELDRIRGDERTEKARHVEVAESLVLDQFADDPDVQKATSRTEAMNVAKRKMEKMFTEALGALAPSHSDDFRVIQGDCRIVIETLPSGHYAGIIADPPYGIDADDFGEQTMQGGHTYEDTKKLAFSIADTILRQGYRVCKENAHLYLFHDIRYFDAIKIMAETHGWKVFSTPLIWDKGTMGHAPWPGYFSRRYECILFAMKGSRKLEKSRSDVFLFDAVKDKIHAAEKPVGLLLEFMKLSFFPGEEILDPCLGAGTSFRAAREAKVKVTGIEKETEWVNISKKVIAEG